MPESRNSAPRQDSREGALRDDTRPGEDAVEALRAELAAARALLSAQREVESALRAGCAGEDLAALVRRQEKSAREAAQAARQRAACFGGFPVEELLRAAPAVAPALRQMTAEASAVREEIARSARRCEYVARRSLEWSQAQMELLVRWVTSDGATYGSAGAQENPRRIPALMDRKA
jgi:hypothetical protein